MLDKQIMEKIRSMNLVKKFSNSSINFCVNDLSEEARLYRVERIGQSQTPKITTDYRQFFNRTTSMFVGLVAILSLLINRIDNWKIRLVTSIVLSVVAVVAIWLYRRSVENEIVAESILVVRNLGIQLYCETKSGEVWSVGFIESNRIKDVLIIEGFTHLKVIVYCAIDLHSHTSRQKLIVPFKHFELPTNLVVEVSKGVRTVLALSS